MRELHWNLNNNLNNQQQQQYNTTSNKVLNEPWLSPDFSQMTRKQQNCEIYKVCNLLMICFDMIDAGCIVSSVVNVSRGGFNKEETGGAAAETR